MKTKQEQTKRAEAIEAELGLIDGDYVFYGITTQTKLYSGRDDTRITYMMLDMSEAETAKVGVGKYDEPSMSVRVHTGGGLFQSVPIEFLALSKVQSNPLNFN